MSVELLMSSIREIRDMSRQMEERWHSVKDPCLVSKPLKKAFEASVKLFFRSAAIDDQAAFVVEVKALTDLDGRLPINKFIEELVTHYEGWLRGGKTHPDYLKYGWTYFGKAVDKIRIKDRPTRVN
jgi:hypothetical protein